MDPVDSQKLENLAKEIIEAVRITLESSASYDQRLCAYQFLEKTKDNPVIAVPCGFLLSACDKEPPIRHLGLQFLEDSIRYHWNDLPHEQKLFIKNNAMNLLHCGTLDILTEQMYIKDKVSRLIVEMMKREWPQNWPELLGELSNIAVSGETQAELVLLIFLRVAEDVATLQNLPSNQRRRDLYQTLNQNMDYIFSFFFGLLDSHYSGYQTNVSENQKLKHCRVMQVVFTTLSCYLEWVPIHVIEQHHHKFFYSMCKLISDKNLRQNAIECLLQIVSRKGKPEERKFIMSLFTEEAMESILHAANLSVNEPLQDSSYLFLKTLTQVVTTLGSQLCVLCISDQNVIEQKCFAIYLNALLSFTNHPSLTIYSYTNSLWLKLFSNDCIKKNQTLIDIIPSWIGIAYSTLLKKGFPSKNDSSSCEYSRFDFDSDKEFNLFFSSVRAETNDNMKQAACISPEVVFEFIEQRMKEVLNAKSDSESAPLNLYNNWESLSIILERVLTQLGREKNNCVVSKDKLKFLIQNCIKYNIDDNYIMSFVLTCISGLCSLLPLVPEVTEQVIVKLFDTFNVGGVTKDDRTKSMRDLRQHSSCLLLKLCKLFPLIFLKSFEFLNRKISALCEENDISRGERNNFIQCLLILSNHCFDFHGQQEYISKNFGPWISEWNGIREYISSTSSLVRFIGLDQAPDDEGLEICENFSANRSKIFFGVEMILSFLRRCTVPGDLQTANKGGFVLKQVNDEFIFQNPVTVHIFSMLPCVFCLARSINSLFQPEVTKCLPKPYLQVIAIPEEEKSSLLGKRLRKTINSKTAYQKLQLFIRTTQENICHIISNCASTLGYEFYQYPQLRDCLIQSVFWNVHHFTNFTLRFPCRLLKSLVECCPEELYETFLIPLMLHMTPIILNELQSRWEHAAKLEENDDEDNADSEEVVNNMCLYMLTRDYLEVIIALIKERGNKSGNKEKNGYEIVNSNSDMIEIEMETNDTDLSGGQTLHQGKVSHLGHLVIKIDVLCETVVMNLLRIICWPDSVSRRRATLPLMLCVQEMLNEEYSHLSEEMVKQIFTGILYSIHVYGQHQNDLSVLIDLAIALYEKLSLRFIDVFRNVLASIPEVRMDALQIFEEVLSRTVESTQKKANKLQKQKKDAFRQIVENVIGKSVGEALKREVQLSELRPLSQKARYKPQNLDETNENLNLCALFGASV